MVVERSTQLPRSRTRTPTAATGLQIIEMLSRHQQGMGVSAIAREIGIDVGQAHRLIQHLVRDGWLSQRYQGGDYRLTGKVITVAGRLLRSLELAQVTTPAVESLQSRSGETVHVAELRGDSLICVARALSSEPVTVTAQIGEVWPLDGTAVGGAIHLARSALDEERLGESHGPLPSHFGSASDHPKRGYSVDRGGYREGVTAVASPILDGEIRPVGAIAISGPETRLNERRIQDFGQLVAHEALGISESLGFPLLEVPLPWYPLATEEPK